MLLGVLPSRRRRQQEVAAREAAGESLWTDSFDRQALVRLSELWLVMERTAHQILGPGVFGERIAELLRREGGWSVGATVRPDRLNSAPPPAPELVQDCLAATWLASREMVSKEGAGAFARDVNDVLAEHRIAFKFVEGELIPFSSDELLQEVVEPALRLLVGQKFAGANSAYLDALKEIGHGSPADAITDAGTALQECLVALGCKGNALGPLIKDAKKDGLLGSHDQTLLDGIEKFMHWAAADRSTTGDAHRTSKAVTADAWLMVHIVGALIVRLTDPGKTRNED